MTLWLDSSHVKQWHDWAVLGKYDSMIQHWWTAWECLLFTQTTPVPVETVEVLKSVWLVSCKDIHSLVDKAFALGVQIPQAVLVEASSHLKPWLWFQALRWRVLMNIINEHTFLLAHFLYYACFEQQKLCCYNVAPSLACIKSKQSGDYTALSARTATSKIGGLWPLIFTRSFSCNRRSL